LHPARILLFMLTKYAHLVLFPVHPTTLYDYRKGFRPSGAKSDPSDAGLLVDLLVRHREKLRRLNPDTEQTRTLQFLVEARRKLVSGHANENSSPRGASL
jgi:Transposase